MTERPTYPHQSSRAAGCTILLSSIAGLLALAGSATAGQAISRSEYEQMKHELAELRQEVSALRGAPSSAASSSKAPKGALGTSYAELTDAVDAVRAGETKFVATGSAEATFTSTRNSASNFSAVFEPILLWNINDHLLFEGELELELEGNHTVSKLEYAQIDWSLNDYLTIIGG